MFDHLSFTFVHPHPRRKPRGWVPVCAMLLCLCISPAISPQPALAAPVLSPVDPVHETGSQVLEAWSHKPELHHDIAQLSPLIPNDAPWLRHTVFNLYGTPTRYPVESLRHYSAPVLLEHTPDPMFPVERLKIASPAMGRAVEVQVRPAPNRNFQAPTLVLLDGATAPSQSGWLREGQVLDTMKNEQVTLIMPTEGTGSNYADWAQDDPYLGRMKWETFLTQELPAVIENPASGFNTDGRRYIGGLSMGGSAAVRIANRHPDKYRGVFSLSGCYSTTEDTSRNFLNFVTRSVGGDPMLTWDESGRARHDTVANPQGLKKMPVYIFTADGNVVEADRVKHRTNLKQLAGATILEKVVHACTVEFDQSLRSHGIDHAKVVYQDGGIHDWMYYKQQLPLAWAHIRQG
ncbi:Diacylglycerol acyltransferase/mycolyltransferase Ag85A precursor [Corynebacterium felinum]|nr:Diacylglycerol acyltransferase/mycolyltransferase Ag85A precursor [Corynebacterium felinum]